MTLHAILAVIAGVLLAPAGAWAQVQPGTTLDGVTVTPPTDKTAREQAHDYVAGVVKRPPLESLVRWRMPVCPLVAGLPEGQGEYLLARLSEVARDVGAPLAGRDCRPNLYVVVSEEPARLLALWRERDKHLFGAGFPATVARFVETEKPVRVWHNWRFESPDGRVATRDGGDFGGAPTLRFSKASRLTENAVRNALTAIVVVDARRLDGVSVNQLADYVAMASLTELRPDLRVGSAPTILGLFEEGGERPAGLSSWDLAFLRGLYSTGTENLNQRAVIAGQVLWAGASRE